MHRQGIYFLFFCLLVSCRIADADMAEHLLSGNIFDTVVYNTALYKLDEFISVFFYQSINVYSF